MNQGTLAILAVAAVAVLALLLRRGAGVPGAGGVTETPMAPVESSLPDPDEVASAEDAAEPVESGAFTSDGWAFVPDGDRVQLVAPPADEDAIGEAMARYRGVMADPDAGAPAGMPRRHRAGVARPGEHLAAGELIGARVQRGAPDVDPWRLEALGRDGEYRAWAFETEDAAHAALNLLLRRIVRPPLDDDQQPCPPGDADYETALALMQASAAEVAMDPEDDPTAR